MASVSAASNAIESAAWRIMANARRGSGENSSIMPGKTAKASAKRKPRHQQGESGIEGRGAAYELYGENINGVKKRKASAVNNGVAWRKSGVVK